MKKIPELDRLLELMSKEKESKGEVSRNTIKKYQDKYHKIFPRNPDGQTSVTIGYYTREYLRRL